MTYRYDDNDDEYDDRGYWIRVLLVGAVAGALVVGLAWLGTWLYTRPEAAPPQPVLAAGQVTGEDQPTAAEASEVPDQLERCEWVHAAQRDPLHTAADALAQWEVHIGAMNKLVVGEITLAQARQFWNQTRVGAHAKLHAFETAHHGYVVRAYRCVAPDGAGTRPVLAACHRAVAARAQTLHRAAVAVATWKQHVHHMDLLRSGEMTPERATRLWLGSWRQGDRQVQGYRAAARADRGLSC